MLAAAVDYVSQAMVQETPPRARAAAPASASRRPAVREAAGHTGSHLVQLGSFSSEQGARRAWNIYARQFPQLSAFDMVITCDRRVDDRVIADAISAGVHLHVVGDPERSSMLLPRPHLRQLAS